jgi:hypothetical protein
VADKPWQWCAACGAYHAPSCVLEARLATLEGQTRWRMFPAERPPLPMPAGQQEEYLVTTTDGLVIVANYTSTGAWTQGAFGHPVVVAWMPFPRAALDTGGEK